MRRFSSETIGLESTERKGREEEKKTNEVNEQKKKRPRNNIAAIFERVKVKERRNSWL